MRLDVSTFRADCTDKDAAMKVLEEASEAREAWSMMDEYTRRFPSQNGAYVRTHLADELADCITACANLAERHGLDLQAALDRVERRNRERGRYDG